MSPSENACSPTGRERSPKVDPASFSHLTSSGSPTTPRATREGVACQGPGEWISVGHGAPLDLLECMEVVTDRIEADVLRFVDQQRGPVVASKQRHRAQQRVELRRPVDVDGRPELDEDPRRPDRDAGEAGQRIRGGSDERPPRS